MTDENRPLAQPAIPAECPPLPERLRRRWWLYLAWTGFALIAAAGFWAQRHHDSWRALLEAFVYLLVCAAALVAPGYGLARLAVARDLTARGQRALALALLGVSALAVVATVVTHQLWATPVFILCLGNAIWWADVAEQVIERHAAR